MYKILLLITYYFLFCCISSLRLNAESSLPYKLDFNQKKGMLKFSTGMIQSSGCFTVKFAGKNGIQEFSLKDFMEASRIGNSLADTLATDIYSGVDNNHELGFELIIRNYHTMNGFSFQIKIKNKCLNPVNIFSIGLTSVLDPGTRNKLNSLNNWVATPLATGYFPILHISDIDSVKQFGEALSLYDPNGNGFVAGPAGKGIADILIRMLPSLNGKLSLDIESDMSGIRLDPNEERLSQEVLLIFDSPEKAINNWTHAAIEKLQSSISLLPMNGWCSWYDKTTNITEGSINGVIDCFHKNSDQLPFGVIQIDDGYQVMDGDWNPNSKFNGRLASLAKKIRESGSVPGIWLSPIKINPANQWAKANLSSLKHEVDESLSLEDPNMFHPDGKLTIDATSPKARDFISGMIRHKVDEGFSYLKLDFSDLITPPFYNPKMTSFQAFRNLFEIYRQAAGDSIFIMGCTARPQRATVGLANANRIGPDAYRGGVRRAMDYLLRLQQFNGVWSANDPDVFYLADLIKGADSVQGGMDLVKTWISAVGLSGGQAFISDPVDAPGASAYFRNFDILVPQIKAKSKTIGFGTTTDFTKFGFNNIQDGINYGVYLLWNPSKNDSTDISISFNEIGLETKKEYAVYSFWDDKFEGIALGIWNSKILRPSASQLLRFTDISKDKEGIPTVIGSNLHISCGNTEIENIVATSSVIKISLNSSGAKYGSLLIYSHRILKLSAYSNLKIKEITQILPNVWKVEINERQGIEQTIELNVK